MNEKELLQDQSTLDLCELDKGDRHWSVHSETAAASANCPECGQNAWGRPDSVLICGECYENGEADVCYMLAEPED